jgi:hypothetical protein
MFYFPSISETILQARFLALTKYLHVTKFTMYAKKKDLSSYTKLQKTRQLINRICGSYNGVQKVGEIYTFDEIMIWYKGFINLCFTICLRSSKNGVSRFYAWLIL